MIPITENFSIDGDDICITIYKKRIAKDDKSESFVPTGHFPNLELALKAFTQRELAIGLAGDTSSVSSLIDKIDELNKFIESTVFEITATINPKMVKANTPIKERKTLKKPGQPNASAKEKMPKKAKETVMTFKDNSKKKKIDTKGTTDYTREVLDIENV